MSQLDLTAPGRVTYFVEVILPLAIAKSYTYRVPFELNDKVAVGVRVIVQFGKNKIYSAVVKKITTEPPHQYEAKYILDVVDNDPIVNETQLQMWDWIAEYYMCYVGDVMQAALPAALKMASETKIVASDDPNLDRSSLSDKGYMILEALDLAGELTVNDVIKILGQKTVFPLLRSLFEHGYILISEEIKQKYKAKTKAFLRLASEFNDPDGRRELLDSLNRAPKQQDAIIAFLQLIKTKNDVRKSSQ